MPALRRTTRAAQRTGPASLPVVRQGYESLLNMYVDPLRPADLVSELWNGAAAAAVAAGVDAPPDLGALPEDREGAWSVFSAAFTELAHDL